MVPSPCLPDEACCRFHVPLCQAAEVDGLLDDSEVLKERKGYIRVAVFIAGAAGRNHCVIITAARTAMAGSGHRAHCSPRFVE